MIEPDRMLRHAFTVALFPEHQVKVTDSIPGSAPIDCDLIIIDAVALQIQKSISAQEWCVLAAGNLPMIWVADLQVIPTGGRDRIVRLEPPLVKDALQRALAECLGESRISKRKGRSAQPRSGTPPVIKPKANRKSKALPNDNRDFIELVDVVEEISASENAEAE